MSSATAIVQIETVNPATGEPLQQYTPFSSERIAETISAVHTAQLNWGALTIEERALYLKGVAGRLRNGSHSLARLMVQEMGKPIKEALAEIEKCAWTCEYYASHGQEILASREISTGANRSWVAHEPLGVVLAVMPWNFPFWQVIRFAAPTLLAGNAALLKHSPNVTGCALAIEQLFLDAGLPENVFRTLIVAEPNVPEVIASIIADDRLAAVSLTGSERAGAAVAALAGAAIKKSLLELGGSDPFVVLEDADLDLAVASAVRSRFLNSGQSCLAAKRFIVASAVSEEFIERFTTAVEALKVGDPAEQSTDIGPIAREDLVVTLERQIRDSVAAGAVVRTGGHRIGRNGAWYAPTVVSSATSQVPVMSEETFGPVASVIVVRDDDEAVEIANATRYGLGASVWSRDVDRALRVGRRITSGALFVNAVVASDPRLPFGGIKRSGYGRELGSFGALEFTNTRTYFIGAGVIPDTPPAE